MTKLKCVFFVMLAFLMTTRAFEEELKGSILWTSKEYKDFILQLDFRFGPGSVDSGVFMRKVSEQIQISISRSLKRDM